MTRVRADELLYPAICFVRDRIWIWRDSRSVRYEDKGLLVDAGARCYRVINEEDPFFKDGRWLSRDERRRIEYRGRTLVCEGEIFLISVDELRDKIVWLVSARWHFESATGIELPPGLETANRVSELLEVLSKTRNLIF